MWGRRRKSQSSHSHTDGFHMGFGEKHLWFLQLSYCQHTAAALTSSLICSAYSYIQVSTGEGIIGGLHIVLMCAHWSGFD